MGPNGEPVLRQVKEPALPVGHESGSPVSPEIAAPKAPSPEAALPENPDNHKRPPLVHPRLQPTKAPVPCQPCRGRPGATPHLLSPTVKFVGSKTSNKYHYPDCRWAKQIRPENLVTFSSAEEREKGYVSCPECKPPKSSGGETPIE